MYSGALKHLVVRALKACGAVTDTRISDNMARKRAEKNGATILDDDQQLLKKQWGLGDCNNKFVIMIVSKEGELVYCAKDDLDAAGIEAFYKVVDKYRN